MNAIDRKLFRELGRMWAQAVTIALVLASGIASFVSMRGSYASILRERDAYYAEQRFADVFAHVERAPESLAVRIERIPGVARVHTRLVETVLVPIEGSTMPSVGQIVSLPSHGEAPLLAPRLRAGRMLEPGRSDEVVLLESFAEAHRLGPGAHLEAVLEGTRRRLHVVGVAMSPEYVFAVGAGGFMNDPARFGVVWMDREAIAPAFRMESSFDDIVLSLEPGASEIRVVAELRELLRPYGVMFAHGRDRQLSNHVLDGELEQLSAYAIVAPAIFLGVAAFLINVVMMRLLSTAAPADRDAEGARLPKRRDRAALLGPRHDHHARRSRARARAGHPPRSRNGLALSAILPLSRSRLSTRLRDGHRIRPHQHARRPRRSVLCGPARGSRPAGGGDVARDAGCVPASHPRSPPAPAARGRVGADGDARAAAKAAPRVSLRHRDRARDGDDRIGTFRRRRRHAAVRSRLRTLAARRRAGRVSPRAAGVRRKRDWSFAGRTRGRRPPGNTRARSCGSTPARRRARRARRRANEPAQRTAVADAAVRRAAARHRGEPQARRSPRFRSGLAGRARAARRRSPDGPRRSERARRRRVRAFGPCLARHSAAPPRRGSEPHVRVAPRRTRDGRPSSSATRRAATGGIDRTARRGHHQVPRADPLHVDHDGGSYRWIRPCSTRDRRPRPRRAARHRARANGRPIARAEIASRHADDELERVQKLASTGSVAQDAVTRASLEARLRSEELTSARFAAQMATHEAAMARAAVARLDVRRASDGFDVPAPAAGSILRVVAQSAGPVQPGTPLVELGDPEAIEVVTEVLSADAVRIPPGAAVVLDRWGGAPLRAHVRRVEPAGFMRLSALGVEEQRVAVVIDVDEPHERWASLGDGFRVEARIVVDERHGVLRAPVGAIFRHNGGWATYTIENDRAHLVPVTVGTRSDEDVELTGGLLEGSLIVVHPSERVTDGAKVAR